MVEAEVSDTRIDHSICRERHDGSDDSTSQHVPSVMELIGRQGTTNQRRTKDRHVCDNQLPVRGMVVAEDLELGIEVERQIDEAGEGGGRVARRERFEAVVDLIFVASADLAVVHYSAEAVAGLWA